MFRRFFLLSIFVFFSLAPSFATEFVFKLVPSYFLVTDSAATKRFDTSGYGGFFDAGIMIKSLFSLGPEFGFIAVPKKNADELLPEEDKFIYLVPFGLNTEMSFYPFSRMQFNTGLSLGACVASSDFKTHYAPYYRGYAEVMYRMNPSLSIGGNASYFDYQNDTYWGDPFVSGITFGVSVQVKLDTKKNKGLVESNLSQDDLVFPVLYSLYKTAPAGTLTVTNLESAEIRNVVVKYKAEGYSASEIECGRVRQIRKHRSVEVPLYADFNKNILNFSENGKIPGEVYVEYELLGKKKSAVVPVVIDVSNRNQLRWSDYSCISSFISSGTNEILETSKYFVGIARNNLRSGLNRNMQFAIYLFEGLRLLGLEVIEDKDTPYVQYHLSDEEPDYIQYPFQTLLYRSGDLDDMGILLSSLFEAVGIEICYAPLDDDFIILFDMAASEKELSALFVDNSKFVILGDSTYIPLSVKNFRDGFMTSWDAGLKALALAEEGENEVEYVRVQDAWKTYPSVGFSTGELMASKPVEKELIKTGEITLSRYITNEFAPRIDELNNRIKTEGGSVALYNKLGLLYVRAGMYKEAVPVLEKSAALKNVSAMNNLGNLYCVLKDYVAAKKWYETALSIDPENSVSKKGLNRVLGEIEE